MTYAAPPARNEISDTYPNPSNAVARVGFGKLWDYVTGLLGSTGSPTAAKAALLVPQDVDFTNRIINGAMMIDQRNAGASVTPTANAYTVDRWQFVCGGVASKFSVQQNAGSVTPPVGYTKYLGATSLSAYSVAATDKFTQSQSIEGLNVADLGWGTLNAQTITVSFWVRSSLTGTFGGSLQNNSSNRSYPFTYTISAANTWEQKTVTVSGDTTGTWTTDNSQGLVLNLSMGAGSTVSGTAGAWAAADYRSATGATSVVGTSGATFYITGVQLEKGSTATAFDYRPYGTELALCQRYYTKLTSDGAFGSWGNGVSNSTSTVQGCVCRLPVTMRTQPSIDFSTVRVYDGNGAAAISSLASQTVLSTTNSIAFDATCATATLTAFRPVTVSANNSTSGYIAAIAEL